MEDESAIIVYMEDDDVDEIVFSFENVEQAKRAFENDFTTVEDFYKAPNKDVEQVMALYVMVAKKSIDWEVPKLKNHSLTSKVIE